MKSEKWFLAILVLVFYVGGCSTGTVAPQPGPSEPVPSPSVTETSIPITMEPGTKSFDDIAAIADASSCASYNWKNRGQAPKGFVEGMALSYAKALCHPNPVVNAPFASVDETTRDQTDAISWYNSNFVSAGLGSHSMVERVYTLLFGSALRESSGQYCEGRDTSSNNTSAMTAEAGLFQTSWNSESYSPAAKAALDPIWNAQTPNCFLDYFKRGVTCRASQLTNWGTGTGAEFQRRQKDCPAFAVDYGAVMLRVGRKHYGPINAKAAEVVPACAQLLSQVELYVRSKPDTCGAL